MTAAHIGWWNDKIIIIPGCCTGVTHLEVVGFVVVHVQSSEKFWFSPHSQAPHVGHSLYKGITGKLLHLDVVKLPEVAEPLDELRGDAARELRTTRTAGKWTDEIWRWLKSHDSHNSVVISLCVGGAAEIWDSRKHKKYFFFIFLI